MVLVERLAAEQAGGEARPERALDTVVLPDVELADADVERGAAGVDGVADGVDQVPVGEEEQLGNDGEALGGPAAQHLGARADRVRIDLGVVVEHEHPVATALGETSVDAAGEAPVATEVGDAGPLELGRDGAGRVVVLGGPVLGHDDLEQVGTIGRVHGGHAGLERVDGRVVVEDEHGYPLGHGPRR